MSGLKFLRSRAEYEACASEISKRGLIPHYQPVKNWDLMMVIPCLGDGNILDMGSTDSYVLHNAAKMNLKGQRHGIDLRPASNKAPGAQYAVGDITGKTPYPGSFFNIITCLSVIEHGVDVPKWAKECARIAAPNALLLVTFDYWTPKITWVTELNGFPWNIFDEKDVRDTIQAMSKEGFEIEGPQDWSSPVPVIDASNGAPPHLPNLAATFGFMKFRKAR